MSLVLVAIGAFIGATARLFVIERVGRRFDATFPTAILFANLTGSFALGLIATLLAERGGDRDAYLLLGTGLLGSYTTFSTFSFDTIRLLENGEARPALLNIAVSFAGGVMLALCGVLIALAVV